ncbi:hypothetical protein D3C81_1876080 [compost metagenome]
MPFGPVVGSFNLLTRCAGSQTDDPLGPVHQLFIGGVEIDHQIAVHLADADHGCSGEHVEYHFLSGAGFHPGGAHDDFRANHRFDCQLAEPGHRCSGIVAQTDDDGAQLPGAFHGPEHIGRTAAGGNADHYILPAYP